MRTLALVLTAVLGFTLPALAGEVSGVEKRHSSIKQRDIKKKWKLINTNNA